MEKTMPRTLTPNLLVAQLKCARASGLLQSDTGTVAELCESLVGKGALVKDMLSEVLMLA